MGNRGLGRKQCGAMVIVWKAVILFVFMIEMICRMHIAAQAESLDLEEFKPGGAWEDDHGVEIPDFGYDTKPYVVNERDEYSWEYKAGGMDEEGISAECVGLVRSYDPRKHDLVSEIRDQGSLQLCWAYSAVSTAESSLIRSNLADNTVNLSEMHAAYFSYEKLKEWGGIDTSMNFATFCNRGGNPGWVWGLYLEGIGPAEESTTGGFDSDKVPSVSENALIDLELKMSHIATLTGVYSLDADDVDSIKDAITTCGAVNACYYSNPHYYKDLVNDEGDISYYMPYKTGTVNHAVSIIGWDDDFPAESFAKGDVFTGDDSSSNDGTGNKLPDGAWLVKNSYGKRGYKGPEGSGFYWISYYDRSLANLTALSFRDNTCISEQNGVPDGDNEESEIENNNCDGRTDKADEADESGETTETDENRRGAFIYRHPGNDCFCNSYLPGIHSMIAEMGNAAEKIERALSGKKQKKVRYKKKGIVYEISNGKASVVRIIKRKKIIRIPARIRIGGKTYPVTKIMKGAFRKKRKRGRGAVVVVAF